MDDLLQRTSRTFAATIPFLDEPLRAQVRVAYLLFRIADTLEDADLLGRDARLALLDRFDALLTAPPGARPVDDFVRACAAARPTANPDYAELLALSGGVFRELDGFAPAARDAVLEHLRRTADRMRSFVARADGGGTLALRDLADLQDYCYAVAGIVGEMLTELLLLAHPELEPARADLEADAVAFGEALQLTNILKDAAADAAEGRTYVPATVDRREVFSLAATDLARARRYVEALHRHGATQGTLAFHALPLRLAERTLERVASAGAGAKLGRAEVLAEVDAMTARIAAGHSGL